MSIVLRVVAWSDVAGAWVSMGAWTTSADPPEHGGERAKKWWEGQARLAREAFGIAPSVPSILRELDWPSVSADDPDADDPG
jgi:hypothetical protein